MEAKGPDVQRLRPSSLRATRGLLLAGCIALGGGQVKAQTALVFPDPLAPKLESNPLKPPRFQKPTRAPTASTAPTPAFVPPASGAGDTGFDSTNSRKKTKAKPKTKSATQPSTLANEPVPPPASPYQTPPPGEENAALAAAPPGTPPVETIEPIAKPAKKRKARTEPEDPYAPLGIRAGAFDLFPAVELLGGYNTNPGQTHDPKGASLFTVAPELKVNSNWSRHEFKADLRGSYTGYSPDETPTLSRPYFNGKVDGRIDVTRSTRIDLGGRLLVSTDNPGSPDLQAGLAKLPIYTTFGGDVGIGQRFNRVDLSLKGEAERTAYQNSQLTDGTTASNEDRNFNQYGGKLRGGYELSPGVTPFVEFGADTRVHDLNTDVSGYQRDSNGLTGKAGTTFELSRLLTGEIALGYTKRTYDDPRLENLTGLIGNASLVWTASALTTVKLTASSTVGESTISGVSGVLYRNVGMQVDHAFRRWLIGSVQVGVGLDTYNGGSTNPTSIAKVCNCVVTAPGETRADREDWRYSVRAGLTYKLNRDLWIKGEVREDWLRSNLSGNDYNATTVLLGLRWQH
jgi:hypothetical protein